MSSAAVIRQCFKRSTTIFGCRLNYNHPIWILNDKTIYRFPFADNRLFSLSASLQKKKVVNPEEEILKHKTNRRSTNKPQTAYEKRQKNKSTVWGVVDVYRFISVEELAKVLNKTIEELQEAMLHIPDIADIRPAARIEDLQILKEIVGKCGYKMRVVAQPQHRNDANVEIQDKDVHPRPPAPLENLKPRPPVVTVMGHVDHGKTTLLDTLRGAHVAQGEAGGITQHIGAFTVELDSGDKVTFLDTPGHAAFSSMRARGAHCTDIIVLVVAAEDGVMPQTKEVINLANEGKVPIIVAINKIDAPGADIEGTKRGLLQMGIGLESHGGDVQCVCISALHGTNLDALAEAITTQATLMELKSEYTGPVEGVVIESKTDQHRGKLSTAIVTRGTLRKGCILVGGLAHAKVRGLFDQNNQPIETVTPGVPVEILGWRELPSAGDIILEVESEKKANSVIRYREDVAQKQKAESDLDVIMAKREEQNAIYQEHRKLSNREKRAIKATKKTYTDEDPTPKLNVIIKADVDGSVEAILDVLDTYDCAEKCRLSIVHYGVGQITEGDIELAHVFNAIIYGFAVNLPSKRPSGIVIREFKIIYRLIEDLTEEINKRLPELDVEDVVGEADVLQMFEITERNKKIPVMGCRCIKGVLKKKLKFKLIRDLEVIYDGGLQSMRHLKNEVESIKKDIECGLQLADKAIVPEQGDRVVCYTMKKEKDSIDWNPGF